MISFHQKARALLARETKAALVTLSHVQGSSPREQGAQMLVASRGFIGSIGGGTLEWQALAEAQKLLHSVSTIHQHNYPPITRTYSLGPDLGQCCGGRVTLTTEIISSQDQLALSLTPETQPRSIILYGAGHVGKSLILLLAQAPFSITWADPRPEAFPAATPSNVLVHASADSLAPLSHASDNALVIAMSHSHELDFAVTDASLRQRGVAHLLLIGSATKRARFASRLKAAGHADENLKRLICPIGDGTLLGKTPYAVALSTAHQLLALDEALSTAQTLAPERQEKQAG